MASRWFYKVFDQEMGPVGFQDLVESFRAGTLTGGDRVRREFSDDWIPAREVIGLIRAAQIPVPETEPPEPISSPPRSEPSLRPAEEPANAAAPRRRRLSRIGLSAASAAGMGLVITAVVGYEIWTHRGPRAFPESAAKRPRPVDQQTIESIRPPRPAVPSVPDLKEGVALLIPGLEGVEPGFSPSLTSDLKTIVYAAMPDYATKYDLYIATRDDVSQPFGPPRLIKNCQTQDTEAYPALSPDGLELAFVRSDLHPQLYYSAREAASAEFGKPTLWKIPDYDAYQKDEDKRQQLFRPQFVDSLGVMFCLQFDPKVRKMVVGRRPRARTSFAGIQETPIVNAWWPWFVSANGLRGYYGWEDGLYVAARSNANANLGNPIKLLETKVTGPIDGPIWVAPQEDVVFYCSPGPRRKPGLGPGDKGRRLWMLRY